MVGIKDDHLIIEFLPIHLAEGAMAWFEHLLAGTPSDQPQEGFRRKLLRHLQTPCELLGP
jgi:hypothetical protein